MKKIITLLGLAAFAFAGQAVAAEKGFKSIFDGKSLKGWNGDPKFWSVQDLSLIHISEPTRPY